MWVGGGNGERGRERIDSVAQTDWKNIGVLRKPGKVGEGGRRRRGGVDES